MSQGFAAAGPNASSPCRQQDAVTMDGNRLRNLSSWCNDEEKAAPPQQKQSQKSSLTEPLLQVPGPMGRVSRPSEADQSPTHVPLLERMKKLEEKVIRLENKPGSVGGPMISKNSNNPPPLSTVTIMSIKRDQRAAKKPGDISGDGEGKNAISNFEGLKDIFLSPVCILLVCAPLGIASPYLGYGENITFWMNFFAMIPLAKILGDATEELSECLKNDMLCGLLNATFGNAVEMIITVALLRGHQYSVVKSTLLGSVLSNMLLVLGMSFFFGGISMKKAKQTDVEDGEGEGVARTKSFFGKQQSFSEMGALSNTSLLLLSAFVLVLVTAFKTACATVEPSLDAKLTVVRVSRSISITVIVAYAASILFQLVTHKDAMAEQPDDEEDEEEEDDEEGGSLTLMCSLGLLLGSTIVVAVCSEFLTDALEGALKGSGLKKAFLGIVLLPIVGNACEHAAAIRFAVQDKVGLSVGIAVGSSVQIALFVTPLSVLMGWAVLSYPLLPSSACKPLLEQPLVPPILLPLPHHPKSLP